MVADRLCRVTVVGETRRVDLAVPAQAPIAEFISTLAGLCAQDDDAAFPAVWSLAVPGRAPFPLHASLDQAGVLDGQVLYLRDLAAGEANEPVVLDIAEAVEEATDELGRWAWTPRSRAVTMLAAAPCWLVAALIILAVRPEGSSPRLLSGLAIGIGLASAAVTAVITRRGWPVPAPLGMVLALSVVAEFAIGGGLLPGHLTLITVADGGAVGCFLAFLAIRDRLTLPLPILAAITLVLSVFLLVVRAGPAQSVSIIAVTGLALLAVGPHWAGQLATHPQAGGALDGVEVHNQVRRAWLLLTVWSVLICVLTAADLVLLTTFPGWYAQALAGCAGVALVLGAGAYRQLSEVIPNGAAGAAGLLALVLELPARVHLQPWFGPVAAIVLGMAILGAAFARPAAGDQLNRGLGGFARGAVLVLRAVCVALMITSFGVFGELQSLGQRF
jgi:type VII secretion integral membrane protein EccD